MGKKSRFKNKSESLKSLANIKLQFKEDHDPLHEGRSFTTRKNNTWSAYRMMNKLCADSEKDEQFGFIGESL